MKKIIGFMPLKLNNKRLAHKNTRLLNNKPLLLYNLTMLLSLEKVSEIYVYCSDKNICKFLPRGVKFLKRSKALDKDETNFTQLFQAFMQEIDADIYLCSHATAPFVSAKSANKCLESVMSGEFDSAFTATRLQDFLWDKNLKPLNFDPTNLPRSQDLEVLYKESSGIYVFEKQVFAKYHQRIGKKPYIVEIPFKEAIDINEESDFKLAEIFAMAEKKGGGGLKNVHF